MKPSATRLDSLRAQFKCIANNTFSRLMLHICNLLPHNASYKIQKLFMNASEIMENVRYLLNKHYAIYATGFAKGINDKEYKFRTPITAQEALDIYTDHLAGMTYKEIRERHKLSQPTS